MTNYVVAPPNLPSLVYGKEIEAVAKKVIFIWLKNTTQISWFIAKYLSTLMLSTLIWKHLLMVLFACGCHGKGLLEIKYPHKYRNGLNGCQNDKDFPLDESGQIKKDHM